MGQVRFRMLFSILAASAGLAFAGSAGASTPCSARLLADWRDGRIDATYPIHCYREALADLPEDVQVYSTARDDITRALQSKVKSLPSSGASAGASGGGSGGSPLVVLAICGAVLLAAGSLVAVVR